MEEPIHTRDIPFLPYIIRELKGSHTGHLLVRKRPHTPTLEIYCVDCGAVLFRRDVM